MLVSRIIWEVGLGVKMETRRIREKWKIFCGRYPWIRFARDVLAILDGGVSSKYYSLII